MAKSTCGKCGEVFSSTYSFDKHRTGTYEPMTRRCLTRDEMLAKGMIFKNGRWITQEYDPWKVTLSRNWDEYAS